MKRIISVIVLLLCLPLIGFGQTDNYTNSNSSLTAEDYFYKAYNSSDYNFQIDNYTSAIRLDPDYAIAYRNRGAAYWKLEEYSSAISDYTSAIRLKPDLANAYYNRGYAYNELQEYRSAISDFTSAIRLDPDYADAYKSRGIAKENSGLPYCSDYKKACDLGNDTSCEWYYKQCR